MAARPPEDGDVRSEPDALPRTDDADAPPPQGDGEPQDVPHPPSNGGDVVSAVAPAAPSEHGDVAPGEDAAPGAGEEGDPAPDAEGPDAGEEGNPAPDAEGPDTGQEGDLAPDAEGPDTGQEGDLAPDAERPEPDGPDRPLDDVVLEILRRLQLDAATPRHALAESALWLALVSLGELGRDALERLAAGRFWSDPGGQAAEGSSEAAPSDAPPVLERVAVGLTLQRFAADPGTGASERAVATLACVALGCADPDAGRALQKGLGRLHLLDLVEQIPIAARIRTLTLEFRHARLDPASPEGVPAPFVARVEDLLEQLDRERLLASDLAHAPGSDDEAELRLQALIRSADPRLTSLARVLLDAERPYPDAEALLADCLADAPRLWGRQAPEQRRRALETCYGELRARLRETPFALAPRTEGYGRQEARD